MLPLKTLEKDLFHASFLASSTLLALSGIPCRHVTPISAFLFTWCCVCVCMCVSIQIFHFIILGPALMNPSYLDHLQRPFLQIRPHAEVLRIFLGGAQVNLQGFPTCPSCSHHLECPSLPSPHVLLPRNHVYHLLFPLVCDHSSIELPTALSRYVSLDTHWSTSHI